MTPFLIQNVLITDARSIRALGAGILVNHFDGSTETFPFDSASQANLVAANIVSGQNSTNLIITGVFPNPMDVGPSGTPVTITGYNFSPATLGTLHFEDDVSGHDDDGYTMACTFVNSQKLTAVFSLAGNGILSQGDNVTLIYYKDNGTTYSNFIYATNPSGTIVQY